jgi:hypothetical protein
MGAYDCLNIDGSLLWNPSNVQKSTIRDLGFCFELTKLKRSFPRARRGKLAGASNA